jgi:hypothetical protein
MGRTISSFRQLLEIEKLDWFTFKKQLPTKKDKQAFDMIFENAKLYTSYLGNAVNPIIFESIIMGSIFNNYKTLLQKSKVDNKIDDFTITQELTLLTENNPTGKILFDRTCKKWHGLIDSLHKDDRELLLKMIFEICNYNENYNKMINIQDSKSFVTYFFFLAELIQLQKLIDRANKNADKKKDVTILDFMSK